MTASRSEEINVDEDTKALGDRWVKCGGGYPVGMLLRSTLVARCGRVTRITPFGVHLALDTDTVHLIRWDDAPRFWRPDFSDDGTKGAALALARARHRAPTATPYAVHLSMGDDSDDIGWLFGGEVSGDLILRAEHSEAGALVAAMETEPGTVERTVRGGQT